MWYWITTAPTSPPTVRAWLAKNSRVALHFHADIGVVAEHGGDLLLDHHPLGDPSRQPHLGQDLIAAIGTFIDGWNDPCHPFTWTKTADELLPRCKPGKRTRFT
jgi:hypothetical protein